MAWDNEQWLGFSDPTPASPPFQECNAGFWPDLTLTGRAFALRSDYNCCTVKFCFLNPITISRMQLVPLDEWDERGCSSPAELGVAPEAPCLATWVRHLVPRMKCSPWDLVLHYP